MFNFEYSYLSLPDKFHKLTEPFIFPNPEIFIINKKLYSELNFSFDKEKDLINEIFSKHNIKKYFAQAYAGHQFGHFTKLGDGRALIIGEHLTENNNRVDVQLKGSGKTQFSRNGDGKATLKSMLLEYLISEAMYYLNIPTSRSLAVIKTDEQIFRENIQDGSILLRIMKSHIRIGTFEYASYFGSINDLKSLSLYYK